MATILIVDDRPFNREFLATLLGYAQHQVIAAADGEEALAALAEPLPALVITDVRMPGMDGLELTRRLRGDPRTARLPIVFYTATHHSGEAKALAREYGVQAVINKPAEPQHILDTVAQLLGTPPLPFHPPQARRAEKTAGPMDALRQQVAANLDALPADPPHARVQRLSLRMSAVLELALEIPLLRDRRQLLDFFCRAAQDIFAVRLVVIGILGPEGQCADIASSDPAAAPWLARIDPAAGLLAEVLASGRAVRRHCAGDPVRAGLPADHPPVDGLLAAPLVTAGRRLGWFYAADRVSDPDFAAEDEQFAVTLAALIAGAYDNLQLHDTTARHVARLADQQARITRLNRLYRVRSGINSAVVRHRERTAVLADACRIAVDEGGFGMAWIALAPPENPARLVPVAAEGIPLPDLAARLAQDDALVLSRESRRPSYINHLSRHAGGLLGDLGLPRGFASCAVLPLLAEAAHGVMVIHAGEPDFFDNEELRLLADLADDVSFALRYIEKSEQLNYLAYYDPLTSLPNATLFTDRLTQLLHAARHDNEQAAVLLLDIDHFKQLNDSHGRAACDRLLVETGQRLEQALRGADTLARMGADRFIIGLAGLKHAQEAAAVLRDRLASGLQAPFLLDGQTVNLSLRAGIALFPADGDSPEALLQHAESALKQAKQSGRRYQFYAREVNERMIARMALENRLRAAVAAGDFELYFQPRGDLQSGEMAGAEALIRWRQPDGTLLPPTEFIPLAEESGLIVPLGRWVIDTACARQAAWRDAGLPLVPVAVNLSALQLANGQVMDTIRAALARRHLPARYLELELTESAVMQNPEQATRLLAQLKQCGLALSLDDFGTGYSSLAYLKRFPFDSVKIDRTFVSDITWNPGDAAIATAVIAMAHRLHMRVIAEGVETAAQLAYIRAHGCNEIQGFYFSEPLPAEAFAHLLRHPRRLKLPVSSPQGAGTLLVVDDDPASRDGLVSLFRQDGYQVLSATGGREALDLLAQHPVQVIVSDQCMPGMDGPAFLHVVKELYPDTLRIILSDHTDLDILLDAVNRGAVYKLLTKPWQDELLREHVRDAFRRYRPPEPAT